MQISRADRNDLVLTLFEGLFDAPPWETFLHRLLARTRAQRIRLLIRNTAAVRRPAVQRQVTARDWQADPDGDAELLALAMVNYPGLRFNRVYALDELRAVDNAALREEQDAALAATRIGDARLLRVAGPGGYSVWLILLHEQPAFGAEDSALLSSLVPALEVALINLATIGDLQMRAEAAESALALLGIGQAVLDRQGQVLAADAAWLRQVAAPGPALVGASQAIESAGPAARALATLEDGRPVLVRPIPPGGPDLPHRAAAVGSVRVARPADMASAARVVAATLGLSAREASLAVLLSRGQSLVEAGKVLRLTVETARNYSKRIYAKTGASGQADLVRMVLGSLAVLA